MDRARWCGLPFWARMARRVRSRDGKTRRSRGHPAHVPISRSSDTGGPGPAPTSASVESSGYSAARPRTRRSRRPRTKGWRVPRRPRLTAARRAGRRAPIAVRSPALRSAAKRVHVHCCDLSLNRPCVFLNGTASERGRRRRSNRSRRPCRAAPEHRSRGNRHRPAQPAVVVGVPRVDHGASVTPPQARPCGEAGRVRVRCGCGAAGSRRGKPARVGPVEGEVRGA